MRVTIGLGSNIDAEKNMSSAAKLLRETWAKIQFSSVFQSAPRHITDQPEFLNAAAVFESNESPESIRGILNVIEKTLKKSIEERFGPRTIDLDMLLYGKEMVRDENLIIPHPRMHERRFVLEPLSELIGDAFVIPGQSQTIAVLLENVTDQECKKSEMKL